MQIISLTQDAYKDYGDVISVRSDVRLGKANMGTADRYNFLGPLENLRTGSAKANLCVFDCQPMVAKGQKQFEIKLLERHRFSTQAFIPMPGADRFLVVVSLGKDRPDLSTLRVFLAQGAQGMTYKPGVWHHPLIAIGKQTPFACIVWEDETLGDCDVVNVSPSITLNTEKWST